jgi:hypothetical protein
MKNMLTGFAALWCLTAGAQSIFNGIGPGGVFKVNHGSNDFFTVNQSNGTITLMPPAAGNQRGSIFKGSDRFLHTYHGSGTLGGNTFVGINAGNFSMGGEWW